MSKDWRTMASVQTHLVYQHQSGVGWIVIYQARSESAAVAAVAKLCKENPRMTFGRAMMEGRFSGLRGRITPKAPPFVSSTQESETA